MIHKVTKLGNSFAVFIKAIFNETKQKDASQFALKIKKPYQYKHKASI